jgi:hypothetical protein
LKFELPWIEVEYLNILGKFHSYEISLPHCTVVSCPEF